MNYVPEKAEWHKVFGSPAPPAFGIALLTRAIAADIRSRRWAGTSQAGYASSISSRAAPSARCGAASAKPGMALARHGEGPRVVVLEGAYEYRGSRYRSLIAIAKHHWRGMVGPTLLWPAQLASGLGVTRHSPSVTRTLRGVHAQIHREGLDKGVQQPRRPA
jgi:hypothetical protein